MSALNDFHPPALPLKTPQTMAGLRIVIRRITLRPLPEELWLSIFTNIDDPLFLLHPCRRVSREFQDHVKAYFRYIFIPKHIITSYVRPKHSSKLGPAEPVAMNPKRALFSRVQRGRVYFRGGFSHYSPDHTFAFFAVSRQSVNDLIKKKKDMGQHINSTGLVILAESESRGYYHYWTQKGVRVRYGSQRTTPEYTPLLQFSQADEAGCEMETGPTRLIVDAEGTLVGFDWWGLMLKVGAIHARPVERAKGLGRKARSLVFSRGARGRVTWVTRK